MDAGSNHRSAAKGPAIDLEVTGSGPVGCRFSIPSSFFTTCSSLPCVSWTGSWTYFCFLVMLCACSIDFCLAPITAILALQW